MRASRVSGCFGRHDTAQDGLHKGASSSREGRNLSRDLLRRIVIAASLYLFAAASVMVAAYILDRLEPDADGALVDLGASDPGAEILTSTARWTEAR